MASAIGGAVGGFKKMKEGRELAEQGQEGIDNFSFDELTNPYEDLQISTAGAEMQAEEAARVSSTIMQAGRAGGTRGIAATAGRVQAQNNTVNRGIAAGLDEQQKAIDQATAQDETRIRAMQETRQSNELAGYGNMVDVGRDMRQSGMGDLVAVGGAIDNIGMAALTGGLGGKSGLLSAIGKGDKILNGKG
tara:strand:+ start:2910 stop:3482 length:573 start_codon:yes stop_codon:yes gene_type:complete